MNRKGSKGKVLIVDDIPTNIKILGEALRTDYEISVAISGEKALEISMSDNQPDLILLDIVMPHMDGYEVCRRLKENAQTMNIPIIFITAKDDVSDETKGLELGAVDYITKPFNLPIIRARLRTHLSLKRKTDMLESLVSLDGLTDMPNRRRFDEFLEQEWKRSKRSLVPISLIMADVDFFKNYNDSLGHTAGDECLKKVSSLLLSSIHRPSDLAARYGGEEFAVILPETDLSSAVAVAERIRIDLKEKKIPHADSAVSDFVTFSIGVASAIPEENESPISLIDLADKALYDAKHNGRDRVETANESKTF